MQEAVLAQYLRALRHDFIAIADTLEEVATRCIEEKITRYPVFIASQKPLNLGLAVVQTEYWYFRVSVVEELERKGLLDTQGLQEFKSTYTDPLERACILLITPTDGAKFVFIPYQLEPDKNI